jgi:hypothetical protein
MTEDGAQRDRPPRARHAAHRRAAAAPRARLRHRRRRETVDRAVADRGAAALEVDTAGLDIWTGAI